MYGVNSVREDRLGSQDIGDMAQFTIFPLVFKVRDKESTQRSNTDSTVQTEGVSSSQENITGFGFQSYVRHTKIIWNSQFETVDDRMEDKPLSCLNSWVKLHVPGPTHVPHEAACAFHQVCVLFFFTHWSCMHCRSQKIG
jgi:hypothetical protein